uniref:Reverse transcriptase domain-containing protein n=1 Tax=Tanacetum cinerariifolium TaxID=118510 RepID=A0A699JRL1_TANCI|nr:hypothetical protein [Tanacetum cinerariifolium]
MSRNRVTIKTIMHAQPEDSNELFQKLLEDLQIINKELTECNHLTYFDDNEDHSVQYKEYLENYSKEIVASNSKQEKEKPPQDFDIHQLVREECCIEVCEEQKQNIEDTMLELVEVCRKKELYCMHDNEVKNVVEQPTKYGTQEPEYSLSMGYEHLNITPETKSDEIIKFSAEELVPILNECEVTSEDKRECDVLVYKDSSTFDVCDDHYEIFSDSNNNDDISSDDDAFEDIEYVEASLPDPEIVSLKEENDVYQEDEESLDDNPTPDCVLKCSSSFPIFEEFDNSFSDNFSPEFETFSDQIEEMRSDNSIPQGIENFGYDSEGDIQFLKELLIDDSIPFPNNESFDFEDNLSFPRPHPEPPNVESFFDLELDLISDVTAEEISDKLNDDECFDPGGEIDIFANVEDDDYFPFTFVI